MFQKKVNPKFFKRPFQVGPVDKLTFSVFISACFLKCHKTAGKFGYSNRFYQPL